MEYTELNIEKKVIDPDLAELLGYLGDNVEAIDRYTLDLTKRLIADCRKIMTPKGAFLVAEAHPIHNKEEVIIAGKQFQTGKTIVKMLEGAELFVFFLATTGPGPERLSKSLMEEGQYLEGYIADLVASALVEEVAQHVHDHIKANLARKGLQITNRYSPGYCGWQVDEQQKLFSLFPEGSCGITLSASSLMAPIKSISGLVGAGPEVNYRPYTCELCSMKNCAFRKPRKTES